MREVGRADRRSVRWLNSPVLLYPVSFAIGLMAWELVANLLPNVVFASPGEAATHLARAFAHAGLATAFLNAMGHFALGLAISVAIALPLGLLIGRSDTAYRMFSPIINALFSIPSIAFVPFIIVWFGLFFEARVALVVLMSVMDMIIVVTAGARNIDAAPLNAAKAFGVSGLARVTKILIPASLPFLFTALRIGVVRAVNAMITAELFFAAVNLGKFIQTSASRFDAASMIGVIFLISLFGLVLQEIVRFAGRRIVHWQASQ